MDAENFLSRNSMRCGWSSSFTHRTVEPAVIVIFAGLNVFFRMMIVLSETEVVRDGVMMTGCGVVFTGDADTDCKVAAEVTGVTAGAGGESVHPQERVRRRIARKTVTGFIYAGQSCAYNKMTAMALHRRSFSGVIRETPVAPSTRRKSPP